MILLLGKLLILLFSIFLTFETLKRFKILLNTYNKKRFLEIRQERLDKIKAVENQKISKKIMRQNSEEVASYGEMFLQRNGI